MIKKQVDVFKMNEAIDYYLANDKSLNYCSKKFNLSYTSLTRYLKKREIKTKEFDLQTNKYNKHFFETIDTEEKAYWLGFIAADGNICKRNFEIALAIKDKNHLVKFLEAIDGEEKILKCGFNGKHERARVNIGNVKLVEDLKKQGIFERKSALLEFPKNIKKSLLRHYLRGYFDGDGSISTNGVNKNGTPKYALNLVASKEFLVSWSKHLEEELKTTKVVILSQGIIWKWNKTGINQIKAILHYLYDDNTIALERKEKYAEKIFAVLSQKKS